MRERKQAREALTLLERKAQEIGKGLAAIGAALQSGDLLDSVDIQSPETTRLQVEKPGEQRRESYAYPDATVLFEIIRERRELTTVIQEADKVLQGYER